MGSYFPTQVLFFKIYLFLLYNIVLYKIGPATHQHESGFLFCN